MPVEVNIFIGACLTNNLCVWKVRSFVNARSVVAQGWLVKISGLYRRAETASKVNVIIIDRVWLVNSNLQGDIAIFDMSRPQFGATRAELTMVVKQRARFPRQLLARHDSPSSRSVTSSISDICMTSRLAATI